MDVDYDLNIFAFFFKKIQLFDWEKTIFVPKIHLKQSNFMKETSLSDLVIQFFYSTIYYEKSNVTNIVDMNV